MTTKTYATIDGNEAVARVAYRLSEVIAIYPITPSSPMGEWSDSWAAERRANLWGTIPSVIEMQSEGGAAGTLHGALQTGALTTTFTSSQGLLLMLPNFYKIAGELTSSVVHVAARALAAQGLSIFGDHSDVMSARSTGWAMLAANSVQEAQDLAAIATATTLETRIPFLHFFDGFRTSHEVQKVELISDETLKELIDEDLIIAHRQRALTPDRPVLRGTAQNPDVYFQARESVNPFYYACPDITQKIMDRFAQLTGRQYHLYEYHGAPDAERVIILMGSGGETVHETVDYLNQNGAKVGVLKVRLYRPFAAEKLLAALPTTVKKIAVLDRCKEPGAGGDPLYLDVVNAFMEDYEGKLPKIVGGRYGLSSKEFTPAMIAGIFDNLSLDKPKNHFTIGIVDDLTFTSLEYDRSFSTEPDEVVRAVFYGLGSDGTVGANKNSIKIIGEDTDNYAQGYFVYDSKKSGSVTVSHLRFGPHPIRSTYLITDANFIACHQWEFVEQFDLLENAKSNSIFLLNSPYPPEEVFSHLPRNLQQTIIDKNLQVYTINATQVAKEAGMGSRINTVMQVCFFALAGVLSREDAIAQIKKAIRKTYGKKGEEIVQMNIKAVDSALEHLYQVPIPATVTPEAFELRPSIPDTAPAFVREVLGKIIARHGDELPVSALPNDGTYPTATSQWEKRNIAQEIPVWDADVCVQCGKCVLVCPHAVIRSKVYDEAELATAPETFKVANAKDHDWKGLKFTIQVAAEDCTGCGICVDVCPAKNKSQPRLRAINMAPQLPLREQERVNWDFFLNLPNPDRSSLNLNKINHQQMQEPLFEFSGACAGCGETPYVKLVSQLFGDRMIVANATGCSSIYGGNLPTTPWAVNAEGRGPAWSNSLFEDNAEFGLGFRVSIDKQAEFAAELLATLASEIGESLAADILNCHQVDEAEIYEQRQRVEALKSRLGQLTPTTQVKMLLSVADYLVKKSVWIVGGDGWAYDIGYGGLDHVLASGRNVNILVMDTEVYSNTGGQASKATPRAAVAKFASGGKPGPKKDLGLMAMTYGNVYVASVAMGARNEQTIKAFLEAEAYNGPSLIIAYSHCIAHGINMTTAMNHQKEVVESGRWLMYRYHPDLAKEGKNPLQLDSREPKLTVAQTLYSENRFKMLATSKPEEAKRLLKEAQADVDTRWQMYQYLAAKGTGSKE
ncbi:MAG: pyruvate:ferredoxin (flavodoxin) oxidoreductase [Microcystis aeruginosa LL13-03]|jgi:pyruvate-ferredoxin/flavodoxin oxidoreductase|nr:pyruvate:ferredoxin (flavodoxin) oxidoreductase [Microcystis aeruginosa SX13-11]NCR18117.1 pyruvate:ferredoxin (flavodoxin) oxidoreductase [Microcystis aeruginosa LL13-03]NCR66978.1 pyruvate:ferredoxin (flavodoxin) oxidoreductase [Microcystis aeruginosa LL11-07]NCS15989.1 pyruvate:ferredoxin (flavodoxin) oxidoreductase [Microcystis aeruginosa G13-12]NCS20352.1 pyruvate:ferredoxin (flavodoxin) oxidoreductase [Microcystis aeruginosa G11-06]NCT51861.1 pyruvate:ferredoxin (flavodoxin) oxidoredu